jgi:GLPGLI family protein
MKTIILFFSLLLCIKLQAQINYKVTYSFIPNNNEILGQNFILLTNNSKSYYFKENLLDYKMTYGPVTTVHTKGGKVVSEKKDPKYYVSSLTDSAEREKAIKNSKIIGRGSTVSKDFVNNVLFFTARSAVFQDTSTVRDTLNNFAWKLVNDTVKVITNNSCKMARLSWRGRDFIAWYAPNISIFDGPFKFCGLPGLILEIYDTEEVYKYSCKQIIKEDMDFTIFQPKKIMPFEEYRDKLVKGIAKLYEIMNAKTGINADCTTCGVETKSTFNYSPGIELSLYEGL